jgi:hypothetical protein
MIAERGGLGGTGYAGFVKALTLQFAPPDSIPLSLRFKQPSRTALTEPIDPSDPFFYDTRQVLTGIPILTKSHLEQTLAASVEKLPHGFRCLRHENSLSRKTIQLLCRINDSCTVHHSGKDLDLLRLPASGGWQPSQYSDFWECCPSISRPGPDVEKYLCLALLLYTANEFAPQRFYHKGLALYSGPRCVLASEIATLKQLTMTETQKQCWIWIWWVMIDSWTEDGRLTETATLLMSQFWAMFPEISNTATLLLVLERFFWGGKFEAVVRRLLGAEEGVT